MGVLTWRRATFRFNTRRDEVEKEKKKKQPRHEILPGEMRKSLGKKDLFNRFETN